MSNMSGTLILQNNNAVKLLKSAQKKLINNEKTFYFISN